MLKTILVLWTFGLVCSQPTIQEMVWSRSENCANTDMEIKTVLEIIVVELKKQNYENTRLRKDMDALKTQSRDQWYLLQKMSSNMDLLVNKLLNPMACHCDCHNATEDETESEVNNHTMAAQMTTPMTTERVTTSTFPETDPPSTLDPNISYPIGKLTLQNYYNIVF